MKRVMKWKAWMASLAAALCVLLVLSGAAAAEAQAAFTPERSPAPGSRTYANASLVAIDAKARRITVRAGGKDETFAVEAEALQRAGALKPGEQVVLTLRAGGPGPEVVTQIERSVAQRGGQPDQPRATHRPSSRDPSDAGLFSRDPSGAEPATLAVAGGYRVAAARSPPRPQYRPASGPSPRPTRIAGSHPAGADPDPLALAPRLIVGSTQYFRGTKVWSVMGGRT